MTKDRKSEIIYENEVQKCYEMILNLIESDPDVGAGSWVSCCCSVIVKTYILSGATYEEFCSEMEAIKIHYKSWWKNGN